MKITKNFIDNKFSGDFTVELNCIVYENVTEATVNKLFEIMKEAEEQCLI